jgi:hypothetical protein
MADIHPSLVQRPPCLPDGLPRPSVGEDVAKPLKSCQAPAAGPAKAIARGKALGVAFARLTGSQSSQAQLDLNQSFRTAIARGRIEAAAHDAKAAELLEDGDYLRGLGFGSPNREYLPDDGDRDEE